MTNKNQLIKEMASDMDYATVKHDLWPDDAKEIAKTLIMLGYRKIPENSVVLSNKEWNKYKQDFISRINQREVELGLQIKELRNDRDYWREEYQQACKEMIEKILKKVNDMFLNTNYNIDWINNKREEIKKQFCVEVEE